ncbi:MAG TPA: hypothetical protein VFT46_06160 [Holophagaceae bacterium]|nr:hypothetical protein [Holophagaceae bacterium]
MPDTSIPPRFVDALRIASPCDVPWSAMAGDDRVHHCGQCDRLVYQVARLTADEVEALFRAGGEAPCLQLRRRADGTVITADCPVGLRRLRARRRTRLAAAAFATLMTACGGGRAESSSGQVLTGRIGLVSSAPAAGTRPRIHRRTQPPPPALGGAPAVSCPLETRGKVAPPQPPAPAPASHPEAPRLP